MLDENMPIFPVPLGKCIWLVSCRYWNPDQSFIEVPWRMKGVPFSKMLFNYRMEVSFASTANFIYQQRLKTFKLCEIKERRRKEIDPLAMSSIHFLWEYSKTWVGGLASLALL